ncbi:hypothetical protein GCM10011416_02980 [Polaribacter pacificus]|uniref:DUF5723 domain-containing protein n=1 Tax=Polaribacter pacificus TaxID=1775173 RepID=A0A917HTW5_9FLAO|nr:DUF5723 family protein [Polaribacter pacificus]GGG89856.1 hypothetical protein GCM10011416_02980 [Polaribacter pacificus]
MTLKKFAALVICLISLNVQSQSDKLLYGFADLPQTLLLNPGAETNLRYHLGVPFLSRLSFGAGATQGTLSNLFLKDGIPFVDKLNTLTNALRSTDYLNVNANIEVFNFGYRLNDRSYLSMGFYEELDVTGYFPKDVMQFFLKGTTPYLNHAFDLSQIRAEGDVLGVLHVGISSKINEKLNIGARLKLYSGAMNVFSKGNSGTFTTREAGSNIYQHQLENVNVEVHTSGFYDKTGRSSVSSSDVFSNSFFGENRGVGFDLGFTYHFSAQTQITGSVLDIGYINYVKNVKNTYVKGDYSFDGVNILNSISNPIDYWENLKNEFNTGVVQENNDEIYTAWRPAKWNASISYSFGNKVIQDCFVTNLKGYYDTTVGAQMYVVSRPLQNLVSMTAFYEKKIGDNFQTKVTYTIDDLSLSNIGVAVSATFGKFQWYGMIDNIFEISKIENSRVVSFQTGINLIIE